MIRILSLFDGMSCGQIALKDMVILPEVYYANEVDRFAIAQTQLNFPHRMRPSANHSRMVQVAVQRDTAIQDAGQWVDGRGNQTHLLIPLKTPSLIKK